MKTVRVRTIVFIKTSIVALVTASAAVVIVANDVVSHGYVVATNFPQSWWWIRDLHEEYSLQFHLLLYSIVVCFLAVTYASSARAYTAAFNRYLVRHRIMVEPFGLLSARSKYNGAAIAMLFLLFIRRWAEVSDGRMEPVSPTKDPVISIKGTEISLGSMWSPLRSLLTGCPDIVIGGIVQEKETPPVVIAWVKGSSSSSSALVRDVSRGLERAIAMVVPELLRTYLPSLVARQYWALGVYSGAIDILLSEQPSTAVGTDLAQIELECNRDDRALERLEQLRRRRFARKEVRRTILNSYIEALLNAGRFEDAKRTAEEACRDADASTRLSLLAQIVGIVSLTGEYQAGLKKYPEVERAALEKLKSLLGSNVRYENLKERVAYCQETEQVTGVLRTLDNLLVNASRCQRSAGIDPATTLGAATRVLQARRRIEPFPAVPIQREATIWRQYGQYVWRTRPSGISSGGGAPARTPVFYYRTALGLYDESIALCKQYLETEETDRRAYTSLAWGHWGRFASLHRMIEASPSLGDGLRRMEPVAAILWAAIGQLAPKQLISIETTLRRLAVFEYKNDSTYSALATKLSTALVNGVFSLQSTAADAWLEEFTEYVDSPAGSAIISVADEIPGFEKLVDEHFDPADFCQEAQTHAELRSLFRRVVLAVYMIKRCGTVEEFNELRERSVWRVQEKQSRESASREFARLGTFNDKHYEAEQAYGYGCIWLIESNTASALSWIRKAIDLTRNENGHSSYMNWARIDEDLEDLRSQPDFRAMIGETGV